MAFLTAGGVTVEVIIGGAEREWTPIGDFGRAFDGTPLATIRDWAAETRVTTVKPISVSDRNSLVTALQGTPPVAITGDWSGSINVIVTSIGERSDKRSDGERRYVTFSYLETP